MFFLGFGLILLTVALLLVSYGVLEAKFPEVAQDVALYDVEWYFSKKATYIYWAWLLLGRYVEHMIGLRVIWLFHMTRLLISLSAFLFVIMAFQGIRNA